MNVVALDDESSFEDEDIDSDNDRHAVAHELMA